MSSTPTVSIIIVTWNAWDFTQRCLNHLFKDSFPLGLEVILVDNDSSDGTAQKAAEEFPQITVVESGDNIGFGKACNLGMTRARGEFGVFLNNDALLSGAQLEEMVRAYRARELRGIYTARIVDEQGDEEASCFRDISPNQLVLNALRTWETVKKKTAYQLTEMHDEAREVDWCSGAFWLFPKKGWLEAGNFDEAFFMYYEDVDLCNRWRSLGYKCYVNTRVNISHACGGSSTDNLERAKVVDRSQRYFYRKHYGAAGAAKARLYQLVRSGLRFPLFGLLVFSPRYRMESLLHFRLILSALKDT